MVPALRRIGLDGCSAAGIFPCTFRCHLKECYWMMLFAPVIICIPLVQWEYEKLLWLNVMVKYKYILTWKFQNNQLLGSYHWSDTITRLLMQCKMHLIRFISSVHYEDLDKQHPSTKIVILIQKRTVLVASKKYGHTRQMNDTTYSTCFANLQPVGSWNRSQPRGANIIILV